jgi:hypothetical protein
MRPHAPDSPPAGVRAGATRVAPAVTSHVLLVVAGGSVSQAAIARAAQLAAGAPVTVIGVDTVLLSRTKPPASPPPPRSTAPLAATERGSARGGAAEPEQARRAVALAMSALENTGVMALGHIAVTGSPVRAIVRVARARGARVVVLDERGVPEAGRGGSSAAGAGRPGRDDVGGLAAELRRRMYGMGIVVVAAKESGRRLKNPRSGPRDSS